MRVLVVSVSNRAHEVFAPHFESVLAQELPPRVNVSYAYISDGLSPESEAMVLAAGGDLAEALPKPKDAIYAVTEESHDWNVPTFHWLAHEKQRLLDLAKERRYDAVFFVDSDLVLGPETLASLIHTQKDVVSAVFWTRWQPTSPRLPQVWMRHPYEFDGRGVSSEEFLRRLKENELMRVVGLGACTLMRSRVYDKLTWYPLLQGLPSGGMWQGEDRSFCLQAEANHVELWADAWPRILHLYRESDIPHVEAWKKLTPVRPETPEIGDHVSVALEAVEEPTLSKRREHIRGRLGTMRILPEIEAALLTMTRGDHRMVKAEFPLWWSIKEYQGKTKNILVRLLDTRRTAF